MFPKVMGVVLSEGPVSVDDPTANLAAVRGRIEAAAEASARPAESVTLVAVSKTKSASAVRAVVEAGQRVFGENRVQEAQSKFPAIKSDHADLELHLIGPLQTNKVKEAVALFDVIESLDRPKLARALAKEMAKSGRRPACLIQVNTGEEPQKAGVLPGDLEDLLRLSRDELDLPVQGLMCIPPQDEEPALHFSLLARLAKRHGLPLLSMGMSADFETAIQFGATHVRVGSAVFGARTP